MRILSAIAAGSILLIFMTAGVLWGAQCNVTTAPMTFGVYDTLAPVALQTTGSLSISCNTPPRSSMVVTATLSTGNSGSYALRMMNGTPIADSLGYNIYLDSAQSTIFGDGSGGSGTITQVVDRNAPWSLTMYGSILPLQNVAAGSYTDTITATILW